MPGLQLMKDFTFKHTDQPDALYRIMDADTIKKSFDSRALELRQYLNGIINILNTDGASNITMLPIEDLPVSTNTIQGVIDALHQKMILNDKNLDELKANKKDVYTKEELLPFLRGGDTLIRVEVFNILSGNNGDGTFTYSTGGETIKGNLTAEGYQIFQLKKGFYNPHENRIEVFVDDHSHRSEASGGLIDSGSTSFTLTMPESAGVEVTAKYFERIGVAAEYNIKYSKDKPPANNGKTMWFRNMGPMGG